jgi:hypothetical protein
VSIDVTVLCVTRHGHATTAVTIESLFDSTKIPFHLVYADIASPPSVERYLTSLAASRDRVTHVRFEEFLSRQAARMKALRQVQTRFVVLLDNNVICEPGWLEKLLETREETGASVVSPMIVTRGGRIHFSAGIIERKRRLRRLGRKTLGRSHGQPDAPARSLLTEVTPRTVDIDFAESHCCLVSTDDLRLPGVLEEGMANAHTTCYASYKLKTIFGKRLVLEPAAVVSLVPIGFGYDLPWIYRCYVRPDLIAGSYRLLEGLIGKGPVTDVKAGFQWYAMHVKYLLLTMLEGDRFVRDDYLSLDEISESLTGYDVPLPSDADGVIRREILPQVEQRYPDLVEPLMGWLGGGVPI